MCENTEGEEGVRGVTGILSLFPKASGWIRTFLEYYDSRHSLKQGQGSCPCVCGCVCGFVLIVLPLLLFSLLVHFMVRRFLNPSSCSKKCCEKDAES